MVRTRSSPRGGWLELPLPAGDGATVGVLLDDQLARFAGEQVVVLQLEAGQALVVHADLAEDGPGEVPGGREALGLVEEEDARQVEVGDRVGHVVLDPPGDVGELGRATQLAGQRQGPVGVETEDGGQRGRDGGGILDEARVGPDRALRDADGQVVAVAVEDRPALGGQRDVLEPL